MDPGRDDPRYRVGNIDKEARVAIGEHIIWIEAAKAPPALQLPSDTADFTDREAQLAKLNAQARPAIEGRGSTVLALAGPPGVGKSALALHLAHELAEQFPDAQLYVALRTSKGEAVAAEDVLAGFLRALGVSDDAIPQKAEERVAAYRSHLGDKRALVLLDNAAQEAQVRQLLPGGPGCLALITSRRVLATLDEAGHSKIEVLQPEAAVELLGRIAGVERVATEPEAARALALLCGRLPLALRIVGARLRARDRWSLDRLVQRLSNESQRLAELKVGDLEVRAAFLLSYQELQEAPARLFRLLSLLGGPDFGLPIAAALIESTAEEAEDLLAELQDAQLLEAASEDRYRFHDLLRLFAAERLEADERPDERQEALQRTLAWYLEQANAADTVLDPTSGLGDYLEAALVWFETERLALVAAVGQATDLGLWGPVLRLTQTLIRFFSVRSYWADWERLEVLAVAAARELGDRDGEGQSLNNLGMVYDNQGRWEEALACYEQSLAIARQLGDLRGEGQTVNNLGLVYDSQGRWHEAIVAYEQSLAVKRQLGDLHGEGQSLNNLGNVYNKQGRWKEGIVCYEQGLAIYRQIGDLHGEAQILNNLGNVYNKQGRWKEGIVCYKQGLEICRQLADLHGEAETLTNLGNVYNNRGRWEEALACHEQSLAICRELGDPQGEAQTLTGLGHVYNNQERWEEALACHEQSLAICRQLGDRQGEGHTLTGLGIVYHKQERWEEAIARYEQGLAILRELGDRQGEGQALTNLGLVYDKQGRWEEALACYDQDLAICRQLGDRQGEGQTLNNLGLVHANQERWEEAFGRFEQSLAIFRQLGDRRREGHILKNLDVLRSLSDQERPRSWWRKLWSSPKPKLRQ